MGVDGEEVGTGGIAAGNNEVCANVALVAEQMLLEHGHACYNARLAAGGEGVEFEIGGDDGGGEFSVCGGTGTGAPDVWGDVVKLLAVLSSMLDVDGGGMGGCSEPTLSATMGPLVALVSAAMTTPPSNRQPTMVVPVLVALGSGTPWAWRAILRLWLEKSKPPMVMFRC